MERAFSFHIAGDTSLVKDCPRADSAIDFCDRVIYTVSDVFRLASLRKLRRYCWSHVKREYDSHRSEHQFHGGSPFFGRAHVAGSTIQLVASIRVNTDTLHNLRLLPCGFRQRSEGNTGESDKMDVRYESLAIDNSAPCPLHPQ